MGVIVIKPEIIEKEVDTSWGWETEKYAQIPITGVDHCQVCSKEFEDVELVFYAPIDNNIICKECTEPHWKVEPRMHLKGVR